jgi:hypothetical protein
MTLSLTTDQMINGYFQATVEAVGALYEKGLYGHVLIVVYSTIDTLGLLDAPPSQTTASGDTFRNWTRKYLLTEPSIEFTDTDLWAARCGVLHTFSSISNLSNSGAAKELQYYCGDKSTDAAQKFVTVTKSIQGGKHLPVHYQDLLDAFFSAIKKFVYDLHNNCTTDAAYNTRLRNVLQVHPIQVAL